MFIGVLALVLIILFVLIYTRRADNIGVWREDLERTARTEIREDGTVTLRNVRDYTYGLGTTTSRSWFDVTIDSKDIVRAWFYLEPFPAWDQVGHTFVSFELSDGTAYAFSIEAKIEEGDKYSALRGMFNEYELALQWGYERDFVSRRVLKLETNLYRYPLQLTAQEAQALFVALAIETEQVATQPRFYNTLIENCTNIFAQVVNNWVPNTLTPDIAWYLTGRSDAYLIKQNYIESGDQSLDQLRQKHNLANYKSEILMAATSSPAEFTGQLKSLINQ